MSLEQIQTYVNNLKVCSDAIQNAMDSQAYIAAKGRCDNEIRKFDHYRQIAEQDGPASLNKLNVGMHAAYTKYIQAISDEVSEEDITGAGFVFFGPVNLLTSKYPPKIVESFAGKTVTDEYSASRKYLQDLAYKLTALSRAKTDTEFFRLKNLVDILLRKYAYYLNLMSKEPSLNKVEFNAIYITDLEFYDKIVKNRFKAGGTTKSGTYMVHIIPAVSTLSQLISTKPIPQEVPTQSTSPTMSVQPQINDVSYTAPITPLTPTKIVTPFYKEPVFLGIAAGAILLGGIGIYYFMQK